jgi:hypothetical protein
MKNFIKLQAVRQHHDTLEISGGKIIKFESQEYIINPNYITQVGPYRPGLYEVRVCCGPTMTVYITKTNPDIFCK